MGQWSSLVLLKHTTANDSATFHIGTELLFCQNIAEVYALENCILFFVFVCPRLICRGSVIHSYCVFSLLRRFPISPTYLDCFFYLFRLGGERLLGLFSCVLVDEW